MSRERIAVRERERNWNESLAEVAGCLEKRELRTKENEEVGKEGVMRWRCCNLRSGYGSVALQ